MSAPGAQRRAVGTLAALLLAAQFSSPALGREADVAVGTWVTEGGEGHIEIYATDDGGYAGRIADHDHDDGSPPRLDVNNPDPAKRNQPVRGLTILSGFHYEGEGRYGGGRIYDPDSGKTYRATLWLKEPDVLVLRGYIGIPLLGASTTWTRAPAPPNGETGGSPTASTLR